ncbi:MAG: PDDEXK nuclease domain-containing protein [bacterium]
MAKDLQNSFPGMGGFSRTNVFRMSAFYRAYEKIPQAVGKIDLLPIFKIPWGHNTILLERLKSEKERLWYAEKSLELGWSRKMLEDYIKTKLYDREGAAITNFKTTLPSPHSEMAHKTLKDPYIFDFLTMREGYVEKDLEEGFVSHIQKFLLELGEGFAFIGRQYHLEISESDYYLDLLFYHIRLKCFVVIELKTTEFKPEYVGKLNFYLSAVDDLLRGKDDKPTIGLLLCKTKDKFKAEYALRDINKPMGVAEYETKLVASLPKNLKGSLPTIEEIEAELEKRDELENVEKNEGRE